MIFASKPKIFILMYKRFGKETSHLLITFPVIEHPWHRFGSKEATIPQNFIAESQGIPQEHLRPRQQSQNASPDTPSRNTGATTRFLRCSPEAQSTQPTHSTCLYTEQRGEGGFARQCPFGSSASFLPHSSTSMSSPITNIYLSFYLPICV